MKKIALTAVLIISVMLTASCKSGPKNIDEPYNNVEQYTTVKQNTELEQPKDMDEKYKDLYDVNTGLDFTGARTYTVKWGDTLSNISRRAYNDGFYYPVIMLASRGVVINPDKIIPGMKLTIPDLERNKANVNSRESIKNCLNGFADIEKAKPKPNKSLLNGFKKRADAL